MIDLDGDGDSDIVRFDERGGLTIHLVEARADGLTTEDHAIVYAGPDAIHIEDLSPSFRPIPEKVVAGDFDRDGAMDLAVSLDVDFVVLHSDVSSGLPARSQVIVQDRVLAMASGDVTGDGQADLVLAPERGGNALDIIQLQDREVRTARIAWPTPTPSFVTHLLAAQLDDDARDELVLIDGEAVTVGDMRVEGDEAKFETVVIESNLHTATLADVIGDSRLDLVGVRWSPYVIEIWEATNGEDEAFARKGDFHSGAVLSLLTGSPAVLPAHDGVRTLIGRFNDEQEQYELVAFTSADAGGRY